MIDIRKAKNAKTGLIDLCDYINTFQDTQNMSMIEIGSFAGNSTEIFIKYFNNVTCIDPWENLGMLQKYDMTKVEEQFNKRVLNKFYNIQKVKDRADNVVNNFEDESMDFIYIDGCHTYECVKQDISLWWSKVKVDGFLGGHDYKDNGKHPGVKKAVDEFFNRQPDKIFKDTSWIVRKK